MRNVSLSILSALALAAFGFMALGSGGGENASSGSPSSSGSPAAAGGGDKGAVLATCTTMHAGKMLECAENFGMVPTLAEDMCKTGGGEFKKGSTPCPRKDMTGSCEYKAKNPGDPGEIHYYYPGSVGDPKGSCEALGAVWTGASAAPAGSAAPAKK
ncbi:MAG: hypothetical protein IPK82_43600 [Polyangiaceae bacterium]|nr:hypothetical protein [Polyangiaceae bacterium]